MNFNTILGIACIVSLTLPIVIIFYNRYYIHKSLIAMLAYYGLGFIDNLLNENLIPGSITFGRIAGLIDNYTYVPLVLTALLFFCPGKQKQNKIKMLVLAFLLYEIVIISVCGFTINSIIYITGPGIGIILIYSFYLFIKQVKFTIFHGKNQGRLLMLAAVVFDCSCYTLIFFFNYIQKTPYQTDVFKLYYISSIISSLLMAIGLQLMNKRMKELQAIKITRKELAMVFHH
jgi:hypothetical protein